MTKDNNPADKSKSGNTPDKGDIEDKYQPQKKNGQDKDTIGNAFKKMGKGARGLFKKFGKDLKEDSQALVKGAANEMEYVGDKMRKVPFWAYPVAGATALGGAIWIEAENSYLQSQVFHETAKGNINTQVRRAGIGTDPNGAGPYDQRLGYTNMGLIRERMQARGYALQNPEGQWMDREMFGIRLYPIFNEKARAGLTIRDENENVLFQSMYPRDGFAAYADIPPQVVNSLLYVENRSMADEQPNHWNPAVEWDRFANAFIDYGMRKIGFDDQRSGGSTLATQLEKFRHSPDGLTVSPFEKFRQMLTASVRAYDDDTDTRNNREEIITDYLNTMPLAAAAGVGEIHGFADGMAVWFGRDLADVRRILSQDEKTLTPEAMQEYGQVYRQSLAMVMSVKKPSEYLLRNREELDARITAYLPLLEREGIISPELRAAAASAPLRFREVGEPIPNFNRTISPPKGVQSLRINLMQDMGVQSLYDLGRMDVDVRTTIDADASRAVSARLRSLADPEGMRASGVTGYRMLSPEQAENVIYSFTLYERTPQGNMLRVQTDSFNGPFNINEGSKLELGSTAKLRTLTTYMQIMDEMHKRYASMTPEQLRQVQVGRNDNLTAFAVQYFSNPDTDKSLEAMLEAALDRTYSASTGERFFTGGGSHTFNNFDGRDNGRMLTVRDSFHRSVNLPFIRMMRDIENYTIATEMQMDLDIFENPDSASRRQYLERFADREGQTFMRRGWNQMRDLPSNEIFGHLASKTRKTPAQLALIYRTIYPTDSVRQMATNIRKYCDECTDNTDYQKLYDSYGPNSFNWNDKGYITKLHPLELWLGAYKFKNPGATWDEAVAASGRERLEVYEWLFKSSNFNAQNNRIRTMIEQEAFLHIQERWHRMGFPFDQMTPSFASALGASGDTPAGLSTLAGILQNDGVRASNYRFTEVNFGDGTPYALNFTPAQSANERILSPEVARVVRREMQAVVEEGTAVRARGAVTLSDGRVLPVGGKTGTGDNRAGDEVKSRTATFVFTIDDRFYGTIVAYVPGKDAAKYGFTSSLPVQIFKQIAGDLQPFFDRAYGVTPPAPDQGNGPTTDRRQPPRPPGPG